MKLCIHSYALEDYLSNMIPKDPQIDHNSDKPFPKYCW